MGTGGRPRDPRLDTKILEVATQVIGTVRMAGFTTDDLAAAAGVGKASIYRRWRTTHALLVDVVADLGVRDVDYGDGPGSARGDLVALLTAATHGPRALAEAALLPEIGLHDDMRVAYFEGPVRRLAAVAAVIDERATARGGDWSSIWPIRAGLAVLQQQIQVAGIPPSDGVLGAVVDHVVLPALRPAAVTA